MHDTIFLKGRLDEYAEPSRFGIYIHVPFCVRRCRYCAFFSTVRRHIPAHDYVTALLHEAELCRATFQGMRPRSVYLGGGTPSCLPDDEIRRLMVGLAECFGQADEYTMECNPEHVSPARARHWKAIGMTRVSMGVQSFHPEMLCFLGRAHSPDDARHAMDSLRQAGFDEISIDLIFGGMPDGTDPRQIWSEDLRIAHSLSPEHVSCYALTLEPNTPLANLHKRGHTVCVDEDTSADLMDMIEPALGMRRYEISNYAVEGVFSAHNVACWAGEPYIGLGPGAHSMFRSKNKIVRREVQENIAAYLELAGVQRVMPTMAFEEHLSLETHLAERLMCAARTRFPWAPDRIAEQVGADITPYKKALNKAVSRGLIEVSTQNNMDVFRTTDLGIKLNNCLDEIIFEAAPVTPTA